MEMVFNKLVRDRIPEKIESNGEIAVTRVLDEVEFKSELFKKLLEESNEVINTKNREELLEELSDVLEIIRTISSLEESSIEEIIELANQKKEKRGGFEKRIFLEKTYGGNK